ncbi:MAG TPA: hypothetical protein VFE79_12795 [Paraburkholderia sp.]|nr:hypothetical protein [Paraburkholderia sp.]
MSAHYGAHDVPRWPDETQRMLARMDFAFPSLSNPFHFAML